jgi:SulP family sulfate permease
VIVAFIAGTAIAVIVNQLFTFTGIPNTPGGDSLYEKAFYLVTHLREIHWPTAILGMSSLLLLIGLRRVDKRIPAPLIALICAALILHLLTNYSLGLVATEEDIQKHWQQVLVVGDTGNLSEIFPTFAFPHFDLGLMNHLLPFAFAVALLNIMETTSIAKTLAASSGQRLSVNQEIFGIGIGNLLSSFISAMPISGSVSRSSLSYSLGAQTRVAAILSAIIVAGIVCIFSFLVMHVPLTTLSALLLITAINIVNPRQFFLCLKATNSDAFVLWMTLLSCIFLSLDVALYIGIVISITLYLKKAAIPQLVEYDIDDSGELHHLDYSKIHEHKAIRVIKVEGELFFGAADLFQTTLKTIAEDDTSTKVIVLQLKNARDIDATVCLALQQLHGYLKSSNRYLVACGMSQQIWDVLSDSGLIEEIGKEHLFVFDERHPHLHMLKALHKARRLVATSEAKSEAAEVLVSAPVFSPLPDSKPISMPLPENEPAE